MPGRRPLLVLAAFLAMSLPACLHITPDAAASPADGKDNTRKPIARAKPADTHPVRTAFGELQSARPGTIFHTNPQPQPAPAPTPNPATPNPATPNPAALKPPPPFPIGPVAPGPANPPEMLPAAHSVPAAPEPLLLAIVRAHAENRPEQALELLRPLDKTTQDSILALVPVLARLTTADLNNDPATTAALVAQLHAAAAQLESRAALKIEKAVFCRDVYGFGRYVPRPPTEPYRPNERADLYLEVKNLGNTPTGSQFLTHVHAAVEVRDAHGRLVEQIEPGNWPHRVPVVKFEKKLSSNSPLHDFHVLYSFEAPPAPGVYSVTVEVRDATGRRAVKTAPIRFDVAGP